MTDDPIELSYLEVASGLVTGSAGSKPLGNVGLRSADPRAALEKRVLAALRQPPCVVAFSGGLDSSAALALAASVARREDLPPPIAVTLRYVDVPEAEERKWQELVLRHLGLDEWETIDIHKEDMDMLGPLPRRYLSRHGLLWPANFYYLLPVMERARGGAFVTGWDGDGLFTWWRWAFIAALLKGRRPPTRRQLKTLPFAFLPHRLRLRAAERFTTMKVPWLTEGAEEEIVRSWARDMAEEPATWPRWVRWYGNHRAVQATARTFELLARDLETHRCDLFSGSAFLDAIAGSYRTTGPVDRNGAYERLFGDLLPRALLGRRDKAAITTGFWGEEATAFMQGWDGGGVDPSVVDVDTLKRYWQSEYPTDMLAPLVHETWLRSTQPVEERVDDSVGLGPLGGAGQPPGG